MPTTLESAADAFASTKKGRVSPTERREDRWERAWDGAHTFADHLKAKAAAAAAAKTEEETRAIRLQTYKDKPLEKVWEMKAIDKTKWLCKIPRRTADGGLTVLMNVNGGQRQVYLQECARLQVSPNTQLAEAFADERTPAQEVYDFSRNRIGNRGVHAVLATLRLDHAFRRIDLSDNGLKSDGAKAVAQLICDTPHLEEINLCCNNISEIGGSALLAAAEASSKLIQLKLDHNQISHKTLTNIAAVIKQNKLKVLKAWIRAGNDLSEEQEGFARENGLFGN